MNSLSNKLCSRMRQNQGEDEEVHEREQRAHRRAREERLDAVMVAWCRPPSSCRRTTTAASSAWWGNPIWAICWCGYSRAAISSYGWTPPTVATPTPLIVHQYQRNERKVAVADAHIHQRLREEGEYQLQQRTHPHSQQQLDELLRYGNRYLAKNSSPFPSCLSASSFSS